MGKEPRGLVLFEKGGLWSGFMEIKGMIVEGISG